MNWKRIGRVITCLLVVCCLIVNMSPIRAEATGVGAVGTVAAGSAVAVPGLNVIASVLIGLGVLVGISKVDWDNVANECYAYLKNEGIIDADGNIDIMAVDGVSYAYAASQELISKIRDWLFSVGTLETVTSISGSDISVSTVIGPVSDAMHRSVYALVNDSPANTLSLFESLGKYENVFVYSFDDSHLYGFYFSPLGILCSAAFTNPLGVSNASLFGIYSVLDLSLDYSMEIYEVHGRSASYTSSYSYPYPIFYDSYSCQSYSDYLTMNAMVFDWSKVPVIRSSTTSYPAFFMFSKSSTDTVISENCSDRGFTNCYSEGYCFNAFEWDSVEYSSVSTSLDVSLGQVAPSDIGIVEGYDVWSSASVSIPINSGDDEVEYLPYWPIALTPSYGETQKLSQSDVWSGVDSSTDVGSDSLTGTLGNTATGSFIDSLVDAITLPFEWLADTLLNGIKAIFVPSEDFLTEKVEALRKRFEWIDPFITMAETLSGEISAGEPPVIYVHLGNAEGKYNWGGTVTFLDLSWYSRYKPVGDAVISGFLWAWFVWRMYLKIPGIIAGMPGDYVMDGVHMLGMTDHLPSRKAGYEIQRQSNRQLIRKGRN